MPKHLRQRSIRAQRKWEDDTFLEEQDMEIFQILPIPIIARISPTKQNKKQKGVLRNILYIWFGLTCASTKGKTITTE